MADKKNEGKAKDAGQAQVQARENAFQKQGFVGPKNDAPDQSFAAQAKKLGS